MTKEEAKEKGFTHLAEMYGFIPIYYAVEYDVVCTGTNLFYDCVLDILMMIDEVINFSGETLNIDIIEDL